ncbi:MAG: hypothetical protein HC888_14310 [Candidatus Competibacteraceae bacterium]|nr:hypothetical protein [Candidatus Competibacteraceae bacterium]
MKSAQPWINCGAEFGALGHYLMQECGDRSATRLGELKRRDYHDPHEAGSGGDDDSDVGTVRVWLHEKREPVRSVADSTVAPLATSLPCGTRKRGGIFGAEELRPER